jgi:hypothetical protein
MNDSYCHATKGKKQVVNPAAVVCFNLLRVGVRTSKQRDREARVDLHNSSSVCSAVQDEAGDAPPPSRYASSAAQGCGLAL